MPNRLSQAPPPLPPPTIQVCSTIYFMRVRSICCRAICTICVRARANVVPICWARYECASGRTLAEFVWARNNRTRISNGRVVNNIRKHTRWRTFSASQANMCMGVCEAHDVGHLQHSPGKAGWRSGVPTHPLPSHYKRLCTFTGHRYTSSDLKTKHSPGRSPTAASSCQHTRTPLLKNV